MELIKPTQKFEQSWKEALAEFRAEGRKGFWNYIKEPTSIENYLQLTSAQEKGENLPEGWGPNKHLLAD